MTILNRYIVRSFLYNAILVFLVFMSLRVVVDLFVNMDEFLKTGDEASSKIGNVLSYYGFQSVGYITELGGIMIVASAAFTLARMNQSNELTATLASGVSLRRVVLPIVIAALCLNALIWVDQEYIIPSVRDRLVRDRDDVPGTREFPVLLMTDKNGAVWHSPKVIQAEGRMTNPLVIIRNEQANMLARISGDEARPARLGRPPGIPGWRIENATISRFGGGARWLRLPTSKHIWTMAGPESLLEQVDQPPTADVAIHPVSVSDREYLIEIQAKRFVPAPYRPGKPRGGTLTEPRFTFRSDDGQTLGVFFAPEAHWVQENTSGYWSLRDGALFVPSDLSVNDMALRQSSRWIDFMSVSELTQLIDLENISDRDAAIMARHIRFTDPINNILMLLLGLPFILSRERNIKASASLCLAMVAGFYVFIYACRYLSIDPVLSAWLPTLAFGPIAAVMFDSVKT